MSRSTKNILLGVVWLAAVLRLHSLFANSFHADEALFASFARTIAVWRDPLLLAQPIDKPPLLFYLQAVFYPLFGPVEWAARMPNLIASILLIPFVALWAWRIYKNQWLAVMTAVITAVIPISIQFSATAFTDSMLTFFVIASLSMCQYTPRPWPGRPVTPSPATLGRRHPFTGGLLFGLAVATKYQAWLFLPLLVGLAFVSGWRWREWDRWLAGLVPILLLLIIWEVVRTGQVALWTAQVANFGGFRLAWSWELWPRLLAWGKMWRTAVSPLGLSLLLLSLFVIVLKSRRQPADMGTVLDKVFVLFLGGYLLLHWLLAIPIWDRYLLPVIPIVALVIGRGLTHLLQLTHIDWEPASVRLARLRFVLLPLLLLLALQWSWAWQARSGRFPIGGIPTADQGAAEVALALADAPYGTVLYDHWFEWQWRYHLFDQRVFVSWIPHADALAAELQVFGRDGERRYIALPSTTVYETIIAAPIHRAIDQAGFRLEFVTSGTGMALYQIMPEAGTPP